MPSIPTRSVLIVALLSSFTSVLGAGEKNITVTSSDESITYTGAITKDANVCKVDANGLVVAGQAGCYNFGNSTCTDSFAVSQPNNDLSAGASFKFKGNAIYVTSALWEVSPIYTVTLDGQASDVNGTRDFVPFGCFNLFSKSDLDPTTEHTISIAVKGASPPNAYTSKNPTLQGDLTFSLINFIYTAADSDSNDNSNSSSSTTKASGATTNNTDTSTKPSGARATMFSSALLLLLSATTIGALQALLL